MENPKFLKKTYGDLHTSPEVVSAKERTEKREKTNIGARPEDLIQNYLNRFNEILEREDTEEREQGIEALKKILHKNLIIKNEDIPYRAFELEQDIAEQGGHGRPEITEQFKKEKTRQIQEDQRASLDTWINYLSSPDAMYPDWAKYWAFRSITQMGGYNKKDKKFGKRTIDTVHAFPTLNAGCLAEVIGAMEKKQKEESIDDLDLKFKELLSTENFSKLYTYALEEFGGLSWENLENIRGFWKKYKQGSEPDELVESLKGFPLEWCTRNETTARNQLKGGDFYTYYSEDNSGVARVPRLAIRMNGVQEIGEVRGVEKNQNIDQYIQPVLDEKLKEFGKEGEKYLKKSQDMEKMTSITKKHREGQTLSDDDLRFVYEVDGKIEGFGYQEDPRIKEVTKDRDVKKDLSKLFNCNPDQISTTQKEALSGNIIFHFGDLDFHGLTSAEGFKLPDNTGGNLDLGSLTSTEGLKLPVSIGGDLSLGGLTSASGLKLPVSIGGSLDFGGLISTEGLNLPVSIGRHLDLRSLTSAKGLKFPENIGGGLNLNGLTSAKGLNLSDSIVGGLYLHSLTLTEGLNLPDSIVGDLNLNGLTSAKGLKFPENIGGSLDLHGLTSAEGLNLPESVGGGLDLRHLTSAEGLNLPESVGGTLDLHDLTSAKGLKFPNSIGRNLDLRSLTSAKGLNLPETIGGNLDLYDLTSAKGLNLPENIGGGLDLRSLTSAEGLKFSNSIGGDLNLSGTTSSKGLNLPENIGRHLYLHNITSAKGLKLPNSIGGNLNLGSLTSAEGLNLPNNIGGELYLYRLPGSEKQKIIERYPQYRNKIKPD